MANINSNMPLFPRKKKKKAMNVVHNLILKPIIFISKLYILSPNQAVFGFLQCFEMLQMYKDFCHLPYVDLFVHNRVI